MSTFEGRVDASQHRFVVVAARFNSLVVERLVDGARHALELHGADQGSTDVVWVPGALETPIAAQRLAGRYDAIVVVGAVVRGDTYHFEVVANQSAAGLTRVSLETDTVITNGILTVDTMEQALDRAGGKAGNKGTDAALAAVQTLQTLAATEQ